MFEWLVSLGVLELFLLGFVIFFAGFCLPLFSRKPRAPMTRLPYIFANIGVFLFLFSSSTPLEWMAVGLGKLGAPPLAYMLAVCLVLLLAGAVWGELAIRRSLDCSGTRQHTLLAMVPLLQLFLAIAPSKSSPSAPKFPAVANFPPAASTGGFLILAAVFAMGVAYNAPPAGMASGQSAVTSLPRYEPALPGVEQEGGLPMVDPEILKALGEETAALNATLPEEFEGDLIFTRAVLDGRTLRYDYRFNFATDDSYLKAYRELLETEYLQTLCNGHDRGLLDLGVRFVEVYSDLKGTERIVFEVDVRRCR